MFDGVLADFTRAFVDAANTVFPRHFPDNYVPNSWDWDGLLTKPEQDRVWQLIKATPNFWSRLRPYPDNMTALARYLISARHVDIWLVTSRVRTAGATVARQTEQWIRSCGVRESANFLAVITVEDSSHKQDVYAAVGMDFSIDDFGPTVLECQSIKGHQPFLLSRPWNHEYNVNRRVDNLSQFFAEVGNGTM